jgi:hypothetical protein
MTIEKQPEEGINMLDLAFKIVQATLATLAVYRGARAALGAWQGVIALVRNEDS